VRLVSSGHQGFFVKELEQVKASFARSFRSGKFAVEDVPVIITDAGGDYPLMRRAKVQNIKKNGQPGRYVFNLHLYEIRGKAAS